MDTQKSAKLGKLLADSMLADEIKEAIVKIWRLFLCLSLTSSSRLLEVEGKYMAKCRDGYRELLRRTNNADALAARQKRNGNVNCRGKRLLK